MIEINLFVAAPALTVLVLAVVRNWFACNALKEELEELENTRSPR